MTLMRRSGALLLAVMAFAASACSEPEPRTSQVPASPGSSLSESDYINVVTVNVNGRNVVCIAWDGYRTGGLSCDWANAK